MVVEFKARRDLIVNGLNEIQGIRCATPLGAFYAFPDISGTGSDRRRVRGAAAGRADVCVLAGTAFGGVGTDHIRISYANSRENLTRRWPGSAGSSPVSGVADRAAAGHSSRDASPTRASTSSARRATWTSGRTSCRRPGTSCCGGSPAVDGVLTLLTDQVDDEFLDAAGAAAQGREQLRRRLRQHRRRGLRAARHPGRQHAGRPDRHDRRPRLVAADGRRPPPARGRPVRAGRIVEDLGPVAAARAGRPRRDDRDRRVRADRPGRRAPGAGVRDGDPVPRPRAAAAVGDAIRSAPRTCRSRSCCRGATS